MLCTKNKHYDNSKDKLITQVNLVLSIKIEPTQPITFTERKCISVFFSSIECLSCLLTVLKMKKQAFNQVHCLIA